VVTSGTYPTVPSIALAAERAIASVQAVRDAVQPKVDIMLGMIRNYLLSGGM
jgi:hypothetical protein